MTAVQPEDGVVSEANGGIGSKNASTTFITKANTNGRSSVGISQESLSTGTSDDKRESVADILSPLLASMRVCALYFAWPFNGPETVCKDAAIDKRNDAGKSKVDNKKVSLWQKISAIYAILVTVNIWINAFRLLTAFTPNDKMLPAIIMKIMVVTWSVQCAMQQTAYVVASLSGRLERVLNDIQLNSVSSRTHVRRLARWLTLATWFMAVVDLVFMTYNTCFAGGLMDMVLVPFGTYVNVSQLTPFRIAFIIGNIHLHSAWWFPVSMTFVLACIFSLEFRSIADRFRVMSNDCENGVGISDAEIEEIRLQHQLLCRSVNRADRFLKFYHLAAFFGPLTELIFMLYVILVYPSPLNNNPAARVIFSFWMFTFILQLSLIIAGGVIVNKYVRI
jgi:hypothetical protein